MSEIENTNLQPIDAIPVSTEIVIREPSDSLVLRPLTDLDTAKKRLQEFQRFVKSLLKDGEDFGTIPGTAKPTLYKAGADKLCELYGFADEYRILTSTEDFNREPPLFDYTLECRLTSRRDGKLVSTGLGSCNSNESRYLYRDMTRKCPNCGKPAIIKGKTEYGGGWLCFAKKGGCGAKFPTGDTKIESQETGRVINDDICTLKNTILKMAKKRAKVDATLAATRSSGIFTQDMEDITDAAAEPAKAAAKKAEETKPTEKHKVTFDWSLDGTSCTVKGDIARLVPGLQQLGGQWNQEAGGWTLSLEPGKVATDTVAANADYVVETLTYQIEAVSEEKISPKKAHFVTVNWRRKTLYCFHRDMWPYLREGVGKRAQFSLDESDTKFPKIDGILEIGGRQFDGKQPYADVNDHVAQPLK